MGPGGGSAPPRPPLAPPLGWRVGLLLEWVMGWVCWLLIGRFEMFWCSCWRLICVCVWLTRNGKKILENLSLCSLVFLLPNLNLSIFLILILLCVGMIKLSLCWYMWIDFVLYDIHLWFSWVWFFCVHVVCMNFFFFLGCALLCSWWRGCQI